VLYSESGRVMVGASRPIHPEADTEPAAHDVDSQATLVRGTPVQLTEAPPPELPQARPGPRAVTRMLAAVTALVGVIGIVWLALALRTEDASDAQPARVAQPRASRPEIQPAPLNATVASSPEALAPGEPVMEVQQVTAEVVAEVRDVGRQPTPSRPGPSQDRSKPSGPVVAHGRPALVSEHALAKESPTPAPAPPSPRAVALQDVQVVGGLPRYDAVAAFNSLYPAVVGCYREAVPPAASDVTLALLVMVDASGAVRSVRVRPADATGQAFLGCIRPAAEALKLPALTDGTFATVSASVRGR
jgi:hypothetical protein